MNKTGLIRNIWNSFFWACVLTIIILVLSSYFEVNLSIDDFPKICLGITILLFFINTKYSNKNEQSDEDIVLYKKNATNADDLFKQFVKDKKYSVNRIDAYEMACDYFGRSRDNIYVVNRAVDSFFVKNFNEYGFHNLCDFYEIERPTLFRIIQKYFFEFDRIKIDGICSKYFDTYNSEYSYLNNQNTVRIGGEGNFSYGIVLSEHDIGIDIEEKRMSLWVYSWNKGKVYTYIKYDFLNKLIMKDIEILYGRYNDFMAFRSYPEKWNNIDLCDTELKKIHFYINGLFDALCYEVEKQQREELQRKASRLYIDNLDWRDFEYYIADVFIGNGYDAEVTSATNDEGRDVVAKKDGKIYYIECKKYADDGIVGREILEKLYGAAAVEPVYKCICITTGKYNRNAFEYTMRVNEQKGYEYLALWNTNDILEFARNSSRLSKISNPHKVNNDSINGYKNIISQLTVRSANEYKKRFCSEKKFKMKGDAINKKSDDYLKEQCTVMSKYPSIIECSFHNSGNVRVNNVISPKEAQTVLGEIESFSPAKMLKGYSRMKATYKDACIEFDSVTCKETTETIARIVIIKLSNKNLCTSDGLRIGDSYNRMVELYGKHKPSWVNNQSDIQTYTLKNWENDEHMMIRVKNGIVDSIELYGFYDHKFI